MVLENLDYADDMALLSSRHKDLQEKCMQLLPSRFKVHWTLHQHHKVKTKFSTNKCQGPLLKRFSIDGLHVVEDVKYVIYLGSTVHEAGGLHKDIAHGLSITRRTYATLNPV